MSTTTPAQTSALPAWPMPSPRIRELLRRGAEITLSLPPESFAEVEAAALQFEPVAGVTDNPVLDAAARRTTRLSLLHWAAANVENPGAPVPTYVPLDILNNARELARLGATDVMYNGSRAGQNAAWQRWMGIVFTLTSDVAELQALLDVSGRSISDYVHRNLERIAVILRAEREERLRGTHVDRRDLVARIIEGAGMGIEFASQRLGYALDQVHLAAILWSEEAEPDMASLEQVARILARATGTSQPLIVPANAAALWVWVSGNRPLDIPALQRALGAFKNSRVALGSTGAGMEGFRRAHLDALTAQSVLARLRSPAQLVSLDMVRLISVMTHNADAANQFIRYTLGPLATAEPVLRETLLVFLASGCNATQAATAMHAHRNTFLRRLAKAEDMLPRPLADNRIHVAAALEALSWS